MTDTAGLKCAPLTGPKSAINVASTATVAAVFASSATARFPPASRSAVMPEPITVAANRSEPKPSAMSSRRSMLSGLSCRAFPDITELCFQRHTIERVDRQVNEKLDSSFELLECLAERESLVRIAAFRGCGVRNAPVRRHRFAGPDGAGLARGVVA